jgi:hypothetical protein
MTVRIASAARALAVSAASSARRRSKAFRSSRVARRSSVVSVHRRGQVFDPPQQGIDVREQFGE